MGFVEDELKHLRDVISGLDSRIKQLEQRATGSASINAESLRMILIGPPGAGKRSNCAIEAHRSRIYNTILIQ
jgi:adenylate kinase